MVGPPKIVHGDWKIIRVRGGYLKFSESAGRLDAHCGLHDGCKMDRSLRRGALGLSIAWLQSRAADKKDHDLLKEQLSSSAEWQKRVEGRKYFEELASQHGGLYTAVLDAEKKLRGDKACAEPSYIPCQKSKAD